jgi:hypothetical protein
MPSSNQPAVFSLEDREIQCPKTRKPTNRLISSIPELLHWLAIEEEVGGWTMCKVEHLQLYPLMSPRRSKSLLELQ